VCTYQNLIQSKDHLKTLKKPLETPNKDEKYLNFHRSHLFEILKNIWLLQHLGVEIKSRFNQEEKITNSNLIDDVKSLKIIKTIIIKKVKCRNGNL
jgi:hypothetical protein